MVVTCCKCNGKFIDAVPTDASGTTLQGLGCCTSLDKKGHLTCGFGSHMYDGATFKILDVDEFSNIAQNHVYCDTCITDLIIKRKIISIYNNGSWGAHDNFYCDICDILQKKSGYTTRFVEANSETTCVSDNVYVADPFQSSYCHVLGNAPGLRDWGHICFDCVVKYTLYVEYNEMTDGIKPINVRHIPICVKCDGYIPVEDYCHMYRDHQREYDDPIQSYRIHPVLTAENQNQNPITIQFDVNNDLYQKLKDRHSSKICLKCVTTS